ncbi:small T antigen [Alphapolyomavirus apaniscus]|uniref:Small T antigen n=1 Tax=Alphapolyomavirus apaniscus TaxID=1236391 RepID=K7QK07_9POLY|nr:small T antigen [Alphapolyomavirus apaniscus]AFU25612.1 small T antigen [Alphapolyomavirus apaniscus]
MDRFLTREEGMELMDLLKIPLSSYGNFSVMKFAYKKKSLEYHPDKGGDPEKMARLNSLWSKLQEGVYQARQEFAAEHGPQVGAWFWDCNYCTVKDYFGKHFNTLIIKHFPQCCEQPMPECTCLTCKVGLQHAIYKQMHRKMCVVWGECFCYRCYCIWFAEPPRDPNTFGAWSAILGDLDLHLVNLYFKLTEDLTWGK